jgi:glycerol uptake facilitator-like aquaporin
VSGHDWLLFLHVLSAFAVVASLVLYTVLIVAVWDKDVPSDVVRLFRVSKVGDVLVGVGSIGVLVFGIWLAIEDDRYKVWDGWVIAALVLWFVMAAFGSRTGKIYNAARDCARSLVNEGNNAPSGELRALLQDRRGLWFHAGATLTVLLLFTDMIFKPGA